MMSVNNTKLKINTFSSIPLNSKMNITLNLPENKPFPTNVIITGSTLNYNTGRSNNLTAKVISKIIVE